jgi:hypothetical protein
LPEVAYVYQGQTSHTLDDLLIGHRCSRQIYREHFWSYPFDCGYLLLSSFLKSAVYLAARSMGLSERVSLMRFSSPTTSQRNEYHALRRNLDAFS